MNTGAPLWWCATCTVRLSQRDARRHVTHTDHEVIMLARVDPADRRLFDDAPEPEVSG